MPPCLRGEIPYRAQSSAVWLIAIPLIAGLLLFRATSGQTSVEKLPVPKLGPQRFAENKIRLKYKDQYSAKDSTSRLALAKTLRIDADQLRKNGSTAEDQAMRFALLREARELAVDAGEFHVAMRCVDEIARDFAINPTEMKLTALAAGMDKADLPPDQLTEAYFRAVDDFLEVGDVDSAQRTMVLARASERRVARNEALRQHRNEYEQKIAVARKALNEVVAAARKLQKDPNQPALSQTVGIYLFNAGNCSDAIPLLAKSDNAPLRDLCTRDSGNPTNSAEMTDLADAWWDIGGAQSIHVSSAHHRAVYWYQKALGGLEGAKKVNAENRIAQVDDDDAK